MSPGIFPIQRKLRRRPRAYWSTIGRRRSAGTSTGDAELVERSELVPVLTHGADAFTVELGHGDAVEGDPQPGWVDE